MTSEHDTGSSLVVERAVDARLGPRSANGTDREEGFVWQLIILAAGSFYAPLQTWVNSTERAEIYGFLAIGALIFAAAVLLRFCLVKAGLDSLGATYATAGFALAFFNLGDLIGQPPGRFGLILGCLVLGAIIYRLRRMRVFRLTMAWGAIALLAYPIALSFIGDPGETSTASMHEPGQLVAEMTSPPRDVLVLVVDGYASEDVLADLYGYSSAETFEVLADRGFDVTTNAVANYGRTRLSVASALQMDYPVAETRTVLNSADLTRLLEIIGGDSVVANWFEASGYQHVYVESGWFGTRCDDDVDVCVEAPWPGESLYDVAHRSLLRDAPGFETGRAFSKGARQTIDWLRGDLEDLLSNESHEFIYAHLLAPHPPLFLDSSCEMKAQAGYGGFTILQPNMSDAELTRARDWYVGQVQCVNAVLEDVASLADAHDAIVVIHGDHGPDSLGQLYVPGAEWDTRQREERLTTMVAARVPGCTMTDITSLVNVYRRLLSCVSSDELLGLETRTYETEWVDGGQGMVEVEPPRVGS